jgi:hypothetical protein
MMAMAKKRGANGSNGLRKRRRTSRVDSNRAFLRALADALRDILEYERRSFA